jgi:hypothetical protein
MCWGSRVERALSTNAVDDAAAEQLGRDALDAAFSIAARTRRRAALR